MPPDPAHLWVWIWPRWKWHAVTEGKWIKVCLMEEAGLNRCNVRPASRLPPSCGARAEIVRVFWLTEGKCVPASYNNIHRYAVHMATHSLCAHGRLPGGGSRPQQSCLFTLSSFEMNAHKMNAHRQQRYFLRNNLLPVGQRQLVAVFNKSLNKTIALLTHT